MLIYSQKAQEELMKILYGLATYKEKPKRKLSKWEEALQEPFLTLEHAERIFNDILDDFNTIEASAYHAANRFLGRKSWGTYVHTYKRNKTNWYAYYDIKDATHIIKRVSNNWKTKQPRIGEI